MAVIDWVYLQKVRALCTLFEALINPVILQVYPPLGVGWALLLGLAPGPGIGTGQPHVMHTGTWSMGSLTENTPALSYNSFVFFFRQTMQDLPQTHNHIARYYRLQRKSEGSFSH